jgi:hypothetical protein
MHIYDLIAAIPLLELSIRRQSGLKLHRNILYIAYRNSLIKISLSCKSTIFSDPDVLRRDYLWLTLHPCVTQGQIQKKLCVRVDFTP